MATEHWCRSCEAALSYPGQLHDCHDYAEHVRRIVRRQLEEAAARPPRVPARPLRDLCAATVARVRAHGRPIATQDVPALGQE